MLPDDVEALVREARGPVVFDADGTLWRGDVGEELLRELGHIDEYDRRVREDPIDAYTWAVEIMAGMRESELTVQCARLFSARQEVFAFVRPLLARLKNVWVVSASPIWAVVPGASALGIENVIGVACGVKDGVLDGRVEKPIPCGEGKVLKLRARGIEPALAFGNGELDEPMLELAKRAVVVAPFSGPENGLVRAAQRNGWPVLRA
jgi:phosphoserine phosphatase